MIYCTACGTENVDDARFCYKCGSPQVAASVPQDFGTSSWRDPGGQFSDTYNNSQAANPAPYGQPLAQPPYYGNAQATIPPQQGIAPAPGSQRGALSLTGLILGILAAAFFVIGVIPCLGWMNWFTILIGGLAHLICWLALFSEGKNPSARQKAIAGLVLTLIVIIIGVLRLKAGHGIF